MYKRKGLGSPFSPPIPARGLSLARSPTRRGVDRASGRAERGVLESGFGRPVIVAAGEREAGRTRRT